MIRLYIDTKEGLILGSPRSADKRGISRNRSAFIRRGTLTRSGTRASYYSSDRTICGAVDIGLRCPYEALCENAVRAAEIFRNILIRMSLNTRVKIQMSFTMIGKMKVMEFFLEDLQSL